MSSDVGSVPDPQNNWQIHRRRDDGMQAFCCKHHYLQWVCGDCFHGAHRPQVKSLADKAGKWLRFFKLKNLKSSHFRFRFLCFCKI